MYHIGTDIVEIDRIHKAVDRWGQRFLHRVYTDAEVNQCGTRFSSLAARFAGKEAVIKALGTGNKSVSWREIEILSQAGGRPQVRLCGRTQREAAALGISGFSISLSHSEEYAIAFVLGKSE